MLVIKKFKNSIVNIKKRRYVTFKNVDEDTDLLFSGLEIKRILQKIEDDQIIEQRSQHRQSMSEWSRSRMKEIGKANDGMELSDMDAIE